jgi:hypothetical protein
MAAIDDYSAYQVAPGGACRHAAAVSPSDTVDLTDVSRALFVGGAGNLTVIMQDGTTAVFTAVIAGQVLPIQASRVKATGTTATSITAMW